MDHLSQRPRQLVCPMHLLVPALGLLIFWGTIRKGPYPSASVQLWPLVLRSNSHGDSDGAVSR